MRKQLSFTFAVWMMLFASLAPAIAQTRSGEAARSPGAAQNGGRNFAASTAPAHLGEIRPQHIEIYTQRMRAAIQITDKHRQDQAVAAARLELAQQTRKPLTARTIAELDGILDIGGISPQLGATR